MKPTVVVLGMMGRTPFAGVAWQVLQYLEGFRRLGYQVYYVEDTGDWPYDPQQNAITANCAYTVGYIARLMEWCGLAGRWAYRAASEDGRVYGIAEEELRKLFARAGVLVNLTGATVLREEHMQVPVRIYLETDPVLPQIEVAQRHGFTTDMLAAHTHHFTYGENIGSSDCGVPVGRFNYMPTRQPVVLDWWSAPLRASGGPVRFTTVGSWRQSGKDVEWNGETYTWSKHHEFLKVLALPGRTKQRLELALALDDQEVLALLRTHGWGVVDALALSLDIHPYRQYIQRSDAEFTVAKDQNIRLRSGWFSDRSACYLASGKPVVTQDTGFGNALPTGEGLFAFSGMEGIIAAFDEIERDYARHSRAALRIAQEHFNAERVLGQLIAQAGV